MSDAHFALQRMPIFPQYTLYCVQMRTNMPEFGHTGDGDYSVLVIHRRYQEFADLYKQLQAIAPSPSLLPPFPPKMAFGRFSAEVIEARRVELERFLQTASRSAALRASAALLTFCAHDQVQVNEEGDLIRMPSTQLDAERVATFFTPYSASNAPVVQDRARTLSDHHGGDEGRRIAVLEEGGAQLAVFESHLGRFRLRAASEDYVFYLLLCEERCAVPAQQSVATAHAQCRFSAIRIQTLCRPFSSASAILSRRTPACNASHSISIRRRQRTPQRCA